jgi:hypothetical protein
MSGHLLSTRKGTWNLNVFPKSRTVIVFVLFRSFFFLRENSIYYLKYSTEIFGSKNYMNEGDSKFELILTNNVFREEIICLMLVLCVNAL